MVRASRYRPYNKEDKEFAMKANAACESALVKFALKYPGTREAFPWGERVIKVGGKGFVFIRFDDDGLSLGMKLPFSNKAALKHSFTEPTHYGLGKHGWVTANFKPD